MSVTSLKGFFGKLANAQVRSTSCPGQVGTLTLKEMKGTFISFGAAGDFGAGYGESLMFLGCNAIAATAASVVPLAGSYLQLVALLGTANVGRMSLTVAS
jgi:hypothetical protein